LPHKQQGATVHDKKSFGVSDSKISVQHLKMKLPLRIAILECDTPLEKTKAKFGGYGGVFKQLFERGADKLGHPGLSSKEGMELKMFKVENNPELYPRIEDIDAIIITGSRKIFLFH
jgi:hypothetical protein